MGGNISTSPRAMAGKKAKNKGGRKQKASRSQQTFPVFPPTECRQARGPKQRDALGRFVALGNGSRGEDKGHGDLGDKGIAFSQSSTKISHVLVSRRQV